MTHYEVIKRKAELLRENIDNMDVLRKKYTYLPAVTARYDKIVCSGSFERNGTESLVLARCTLTDFQLDLLKWHNFFLDVVKGYKITKHLNGAKRQKIAESMRVFREYVLLGYTIKRIAGDFARGNAIISEQYIRDLYAASIREIVKVAEEKKMFD